MTSLPEIQCPTCLKFFGADMKSPDMPFCSSRCKMADLHHWFSEDIGLPVAVSDLDEEEDVVEPPPVQREWRFD